MKIINPNTFYDELITTGDISLYAYNTYKDDNGYIRDTLNLEIFNKSGEWLENQINEFNTYDDKDEVSYGNLSYLSTVLDDTSFVVPQYTELFKLEVICFEKDREKVIDLFDRYAADLNNYQYSDNDNNDIFITLGEHSTPVYGEKQDIGGAERFIVSLSILVRVTSGVINSKNIDIEIYNENTNSYEKIKYITFDIRRDSDILVDSKAGYEKSYDVNKTDLTINIGALYLNDYLSRKVMEYLIIPEKMDNQVRIKYRDTNIKISEINEADGSLIEKDLEAEYDMYIISMNPKLQFGTPVSYSVSLKKVNQ